MTQGQLPAVTVITILFNEESYLREAIESVLTQDFDDFEYLLVDDGSTDSSGEICREYERLHPGRVKYLRHPDGDNHGMSAARNLGLAEARGDFVAFLDGDDRWNRSKLTEQVALLRQMADVDAVGGAVRYWASHAGGADKVVPTSHVCNRRIPPGEASLNMYPLGGAHAPSMSDLLFRREALVAIGGSVEGFVGAYEDQALLAKFYLRFALYFTDSVWSDYRIHPGSCMAAVHRHGLYRDARKRFLTWFRDYREKSGHSSSDAVGRAIGRELRKCDRSPFRQRLAEGPVGPIVRRVKSAVRNVRPVAKKRPAILMYHRVADETFDPWQLAVSPDKFSAQLDWIASNRTILSLVEFAELHRRGKLPSDAVALTFDDGYACNLQRALPLLERRKLPATIFLPADLIGATREFWWDELQTIVLNHPGNSLRVDRHHVEIGEKDFSDDRWRPSDLPRTARQRAYRQIWSILYDLTPAGIDRCISELRRQSHVETRQTHRAMTIDELRAVRSEFVEFGSHALSHPSLPSLPSAEKNREVAESLSACAQLTGSQPRAFAYPYGDLDAESEALVEQAGFLCACRADGGFVRPSSSIFALPRVLVGDWEASTLARRLGL
ncbi:glycosyltransferase [Sphingomonas daechungensis]|uniref:glycosyltransferase n=1 Tax=Sphingomonas daechungensis TaxID=1176646 RepID=UPI0037834DED